MEDSLSDEQVLERICGRCIHMPSGRSYHVKFNPPKKDNTDDETGEALTQRADDNEETVKSRLAEYKEKTKPLIDYYSAKVVNLDGNENMTRIRETAVKEISGQYLTKFFIAMGAPGCGKGTLCAYLKEDPNLFHLSTGDLLRKEVKESTQLGIDAEEIMEKGGLVPDDLVKEKSKKIIKIKIRDLRQIPAHARAGGEARQADQDLEGALARRERRAGARAHLRPLRPHAVGPLLPRHRYYIILN